MKVVALRYLLVAEINSKFKVIDEKDGSMLSRYEVNGIKPKQIDESDDRSTKPFGFCPQDPN